MKTVVIVAMGINREIGKNNSLLWHLPEDMKYFRETTTGHTVITGRKNYESIPEKYRPLKDRMNIVVTRQQHYVALGAEIATSLESALEMARNGQTNKSFIIGGGTIYSEAFQKNLVYDMLVT